MNSNFIDTYRETKETVRRFITLSKKESTGKKFRQIWAKRAITLNLFLDNHMNSVEYHAKMEKLNMEWNLNAYTHRTNVNRAVNENKQNDRRLQLKQRLQNKARVKNGNI